ncbi:hypothetical protein T08_12593, partial [Trichinella sp. T8]
MLLSSGDSLLHRMPLAKQRHKRKYFCRRPLHCVAPTQCGGLDDGCWGYLKLGPFSSVAHDGGPLRLGRSSLNAFQNGNSVLGDRFFRSSNSVAVTVAVRFFLVLLDVGQQRPALGYGWQFDRCDQP